MKKLLIVLLAIIPMVSFAQSETYVQGVFGNSQTIYHQLVSTPGEISKLIDVDMPKLGNLDTCVRIIVSKRGNHYLYKIEDTNDLNSVSRIVYIDYSELLKVNKALKKIAKDVDYDCQTNPDYLENRYITEDGFRIGYYVKNGKADWFVKMGDKNYSVVRLSKDVIFENFTAAQKKIESLKRLFDDPY